MFIFLGFLFAAVQCPSLTNPSNGQVTVTGLGVGSTATYTCNSGFSLSTATATRVCGSDGTWIGPEPTCSGTHLVFFAKTAHGLDLCAFAIVKLADAGVEQKSGVLLSEATQSPFFKEALSVFFAAVQCPSLTSPQNGQVTVSGLSVGSTASYICNSGFSLSTSTQRVCGSDGTWIGPEPTCSSTHLSFTMPLTTLTQ